MENLVGASATSAEGIDSPTRFKNESALPTHFLKMRRRKKIIKKFKYIKKSKIKFYITIHKKYLILSFFHKLNAL